MANYKERLKKLEEILDGTEIDIDELRGVSFHGLPGDVKHRPIVWRILLKFLPLEKVKWTDFLESKRANYAQFVEETLKTQQTDDPLNPDSSSWSDYYKDNEVLLQIDKDVRAFIISISDFDDNYFLD